MTQKHLSEKDSMLLSAYFDGELSEGKLRDFELRLKEEPQLRAHLESLRTLRQDVRDHCLERSKQIEVDVWSAVKEKIEEEPSFSLSEVFIGFTEKVREYFRLEVVAPVALTACAVLIATVPKDAYQTSGFNRSSGLGLFSKTLSQKEIQPVSFDRVQDRAPLVIPENVYVTYRKGIREARDQRRNRFKGVDLMNQNFVQGGLRSQGADIDWISSAREFEIYPSQNRQAPPVIWVARTPNSQID